MEEPLTTALAWVHPLVMLTAICTGGWVLRLGLRMRAVRGRGQKRPKAWWHQHIRFARAALTIGLVGLVLGPLTWVGLRGEPLLSSLHGKVGVATATLALGAWLVGRRLAVGRGQRELHALLGILTVLGALVALLTGLELLP